MSSVADTAQIDTVTMLKRVANMKTTKYLHILLFFTIAIIITYFIVRIVMSFSSVYNQYTSLNNDLASRKRKFTVPGTELSTIEDDNADDIGDGGVVYINDTIESTLMNMENTQANDIQALVNYRKNSKNGANYTFNATVNANVLSPEFDDYVYPDPRSQEKSFWEYLFSP